MIEFNINRENKTLKIKHSIYSTSGGDTGVLILDINNINAFVYGIEQNTSFVNSFDIKLSDITIGVKNFNDEDDMLSESTIDSIIIKVFNIKNNVALSEIEFNRSAEDLEGF